jgi:hypothetical protein
LIPKVLIRYSLAAIRGLLAATVLARDCLDHTAASPETSGDAPTRPGP